MALNIAIDGPAGAGKSTIAKLLSKKLGIVYVDTGAMYRTIALYLLEKKADLEDEASVESMLGDININITHNEDGMHIFLNDRDVTAMIRDEAVGNAASKTSAYACVRQKLLSLQRDIAAECDCVMDGRDIGSFILPDAQVKIYLTASVQARTQRRYDELKGKGEDPVWDEIMSGISQRDKQDMNRKISPLVQTEDAVYLDSSDMDIGQVVDRIIEISTQKGALTR